MICVHVANLVSNAPDVRVLIRNEEDQRWLDSEVVIETRFSLGHLSVDGVVDRCGRKAGQCRPAN